ncbi:MAG: hypothetical protein ACK5B9_09020 [Flavobacteriia bacterium]|jgi:quercetin dioxygenase-like cupin family protein
MNISTINDQTKPLSTKVIFENTEGKVIALKILKGEFLKEHITKTPAFLVLIHGETVFENEKGEKHTLLTGDFVPIEANVKHWLVASQDSDLILIK